MEIEQKVKISINPPPQDRKCMRCGKHISELKPFTKDEQFPNLTTEYEGAKLIKTFRSMCEEIEEYEKILSEFSAKNNGDNIPELEEKYGKEKVDDAFLYSEVVGTVEASWECRDCIIK